MAPASLPSSIADLRHFLERVESRGRAARAVLPFEVSEIDARLPQGGLPRASAGS
jgi:hypothetical protein